MGDITIKSKKGTAIRVVFSFALLICMAWGAYTIFYKSDKPNTGNENFLVSKVNQHLTQVRKQRNSSLKESSELSGKFVEKALLKDKTGIKQADIEQKIQDYEKKRRFMRLQLIKDPSQIRLNDGSLITARDAEQYCHFIDVEIKRLSAKLKAQGHGAGRLFGQRGGKTP